MASIDASMIGDPIKQFPIWPEAVSLEIVRLVAKLLFQKLRDLRRVTQFALCEQIGEPLHLDVFQSRHLISVLGLLTHRDVVVWVGKLKLFEGRKGCSSPLSNWRRLRFRLFLYTGAKRSALQPAIVPAQKNARRNRF